MTKSNHRFKSPPRTYCTFSRARAVNNSNSRAGVISKRKIKTKERQISWQLHLYPWHINTLCTASGRRPPCSMIVVPPGCRSIAPETNCRQAAAAPHCSPLQAPLTVPSGRPPEASPSSCNTCQQKLLVLFVGFREKKVRGCMALLSSLPPCFSSSANASTSFVSNSSASVNGWPMSLWMSRAYRCYPGKR